MIKKYYPTKFPKESQQWWTKAEEGKYQGERECVCLRIPEEAQLGHRRSCSVIRGGLLRQLHLVNSKCLFSGF